MNPAEKIAEVIDAHTPTGAEGIVDCYCGPLRFDTFREHADHVAAEVVKALGLAGEMRTNVMSSAGMTTHQKTGVTTSHSDIRYDHRYVTPWTEEKP